MKLIEIKPLNEAYKTRINSLEEVKALLNKHCGDALKTFGEPLVRGMSASGDFIVLRGEDGGRKSANTSNYYTEIMDEVLPPEFPRRSKSIICASYPNISHAAEYGSAMYCLFPMDLVAIGVVPEQDLFAVKLKLGGVENYIFKWNDEFEKLGVDDSSFDRIVSDLEHFKSELEDDAPKWLQQMDDIAEEITDVYVEPFGLTDTSDPWYNDAKHECWIGGNVVAVEYTRWQELLADNSWIET